MTEADDPHVRELLDRIEPGTRVSRLGGWMSLNLRLESPGLVLRVHHESVSRNRLRAIQTVRSRVAEAGLTVPVAIAVDGSATLRCGRSWAELEPYLPHEQVEQSWDCYPWLFRAMGTLQRALATIDAAVPRPIETHFAAPTTLQRWVAPTRAAVQSDAEARELADLLEGLVNRLRSAWTPATALPVQLVHGDVKPENICRAPDGSTVYLDFGALALRPRIHDLAFTFTHTVLTQEGSAGFVIPLDPRTLPWDRVPALISDYERAVGWSLTPLERRALIPYTVAARLFFAARAWSFDDAEHVLRSQRPALDLCRWLLDHPDALTG